MLYAIPIILKTLFWATIPDPAKADGTIRVQELTQEKPTILGIKPYEHIE